MTIRYLPKFKKQYKKLPLKLQLQFDERVQLFTVDPTLPMLKVHPLKGEYKGYWSMSVSGDIRALSSSQQTLCKQRETMPNDRDLYTQAMQNLQANLETDLRQFYSRY